MYITTSFSGQTPTLDSFLDNLKKDFSTSELKKKKTCAGNYQKIKGKKTRVLSKNLQEKWEKAASECKM
jgi:hypothetical protein